LANGKIAQTAVLLLLVVDTAIWFSFGCLSNTAPCLQCIQLQDKSCTLKWWLRMTLIAKNMKHKHSVLFASRVPTTYRYSLQI